MIPGRDRGWSPSNGDHQRLVPRPLPVPADEVFNQAHHEDQRSSQQEAAKRYEDRHRFTHRSFDTYLSKKHPCGYEDRIGVRA